MKLLAPAGALLLTAAAATLSSCSKQPPVPAPVPPSDRCAADLAPFLSSVGNSAHARQIDSASDLIAGDSSSGRVGDYLLANDRIRVVVQAPGRHIGPNPYGGQLVDADLVRSDGSGHDSFGKIAPLYSFGRTLETSKVSVMNDGSGGGAAVVVADGTDAVNDYLNVRSMLQNFIPNAPLTADPDQELPLLVSTYYILNPGESRVRMVTAFCNTDTGKSLSLPVGDLIDSGGTLEFFQPTSCTGGFGYRSDASCLVSDMSWYGLLGKDTAYGYAPYLPSAPSTPSTNNAALVVAGVIGTLLATGDKAGIDALLSYTDPSVQRRDNELKIPAAGSAVLVRDLVVGRELGEVASLIATYRNQALALPMGDIQGAVTVDGKPVAGARIALERDLPLANGGSRHVVETVFSTDEQGSYRGHLPASDYTISAWMPGAAPTASAAVSIPGAGSVTRDFSFAAPRTLSVEIRDVNGNFIPGKLTLLCQNFPCPIASSALVKYRDAVRDAWPDNVALIEHVGPSGKASVLVPAGKYRAVVTRGPAWSVWPVGWKPYESTDVATGELIDLSAADATLQATLAPVLDHAGWLGADFHVHAVNSPDSYVANSDRLLSFMAEGVDVLVSTDHDFVTDFAPLNKQLGGDAFLSTVVGEEITTFDYGHTNIFPLTADPNDLSGGAVDWAGGDGPSLTPAQLFAAGRSRGATTVHVNHPRGGSQGIFSALRLDTDTGATHADPKSFRMEAQPAATADDSKLMSFDFQAVELLNGAGDKLEGSKAKFNDWFSFLSRGVLAAATGVSDTHTRFSMGGGYWRSWVQTGTDSPAQFDPAGLSMAVNKMKIVPSIAPFVKFTAQALDGAGGPLGNPASIGETLTAQGNQLELTVDIQIASWLRVTGVEILTHIHNGDVPCSQSSDPKANPRSRIACNGGVNTNWPSDGIAASAAILPADVVTETAAQKDGVTYSRSRVVKKFRIPVPPQDTWYVALVYGAGSMFPLVYAGVDPKTHKAVDVSPGAFTNPIFIDADGNGYDRFPGGKMTRRHAGAAPAPKPRPEPRPMDRSAFERFIDLILGDEL